LPYAVKNKVSTVRPAGNTLRGFDLSNSCEYALQNIHIVLVETTHPGNIGATARVMKNMGLRNLSLVSPTAFGADTEAFPMSSGAYGIVKEARTYLTPADALHSMIMVVGTSARLSTKRRNAKTPDEIVPDLLEKAVEGPVAIVFGRESNGLNNEELKLCTDHMIVPSDSRFASLNLAQAVGIIAYEIFKRVSRSKGFQARKSRPASTESRERMYTHIEELLLRVRYLEESNPLRMMREIRRIMNTAQMDDRDTTIVRGMIRKISNAIKIRERKIGELENKLVRYTSTDSSG
jgi:tRNA (cytidine32/uridine32-2'-O)-methyltransferase